ncbi:LuxR family transcriptional regulator [Asanoa iriomotensis]
MVVDGPFGVGKTHVLKAAGIEGAERGLTVVAGRTSITDQPIPIHLLISFLRHATADRADLDDLVRPGRNPFWLMDRVGELAAVAARRHPLVVVLDDAQRIDDVSALALRALVQSLASSPVLWLLARRPARTEPLTQSVFEWLIDNAATRVTLGPLEDEAVADLCASFLGARPDASVLGWAARCGGNPRLMENVFSALIKAGQMIITDGAASVVAERLPDGVRTMVHDLLDGFSPAVRQLLVAGGRIGAAFTAEEAAAELGDPSLDLSSAVDEAVRVGLVRRDGAALTFHHEVIGEALRPAVSSPAPLPRPSPPTTAACGCADLTTEAISLVARDEDGPRALARALRLLAGAGRGAQAHRLADLALRTGFEAAAEARLVLDLVPGLRDADGHGMAATLLTRTLARPDICELDRAKLNRALAETPHAGRASWDGGRHSCERPLWTWLVRALVAADQFEEATAVLDAVRREANERGTTVSAALWHGHRADLLLALGQLDEARTAAGAAVRLADRSAPADSVPARLVLAGLSLHDGDLVSAGDQLRGVEQGGGVATADRARLDWTLARFHAAGGRPSTMVFDDPLLFTETPTAAAALVRQAKELGLRTEAQAAADVAAQVARRNPAVQSLAAGAAHADGVLRDDPAALHRAADLYRLAGRPLAAGAGLDDAARVARGGGVRLLGTKRPDAHSVRRLGPERPKSGWESLTTAELRVVRAIVDGRTNREAASMLFLSPHTVDTHLRRVFSKLAIKSRVELTKSFIAYEARVS